MLKAYRVILRKVAVLIGSVLLAILAVIVIRTILYTSPPSGESTAVQVELAEGGRALGWFGDTIRAEEIQIGMPVQVVPRVFEDTEDIRVYYTVEKPGTTWGKAPTPHLG